RKPFWSTISPNCRCAWTASALQAPSWPKTKGLGHERLSKRRFRRPRSRGRAKQALRTALRASFVKPQFKCMILSTSEGHEMTDRKQETPEPPPAPETRQSGGGDPGEPRPNGRNLGEAKS